MHKALTLTCKDKMRFDSINTIFPLGYQIRDAIQRNENIMTDSLKIIINSQGKLIFLSISSISNLSSKVELFDSPACHKVLTHSILPLEISTMIEDFLWSTT